MTYINKLTLLAQKYIIVLWGLEIGKLASHATSGKLSLSKKNIEFDKKTSMSRPIVTLATISLYTEVFWEKFHWKP